MDTRRAQCQQQETTEIPLAHELPIDNRQLKIIESTITKSSRLQGYVTANIPPLEANSSRPTHISTSLCLMLVTL